MKAPSHWEIFKALANDENIFENIDVCDEFDKDKFGNSMMTLSFQGVAPKGKKPCKGLVVLVFNPKGRLVNIEVATKKRGERNWQIATSQNFINLAFRGFVG
jgi:hypothetical protein